MICGNCGKPAETVDTVRACHAGEVFPCGWLVDLGPHWEDGSPQVEECGAHSSENPRGWSCEAGHEHVSMEARHAEGWDYAHDSEEAKRLAAVGVDSVGMDGGSVPQYVGV